MGDKSEARSHLSRTLKALERAVAGLLLALLFAFMVTVIVSLPYVLIRQSSENLPRGLHALVLASAALLLGGGIFIISTEDLRRKWFPWIFQMFGPFGPPVYCALILVSAGALMASLTFILLDAGLVDMSSNLPGGITEARLLDFYMWHFFELIPFVSINETANLAEPATYSGTWVGILVLAFQGLVVVPILATVRYYWKYGREETRRERRLGIRRRRLSTFLDQGREGETLSDFEARIEGNQSVTSVDQPAEEERS